MPSFDPRTNAKGLLHVRVKDHAGTAPTGADLVQIDSKGYRWARFDYNFGNLDGTGPINIQVTSATTSGGSHTNVVGATASRTVVQDNTMQSIVVDTNKTGRFLTSAFTMNSTTIALLGATCTLFHNFDASAVDPNVATIV